MIFDVDIKFRDILLPMGADPIMKSSRVRPNFIEEAYLALEEEGLPRVAGRLPGAPLVADPTRTIRGGTGPGRCRQAAAQLPQFAT